MFVDDIKVIGVKKLGYSKKIKKELAAAFKIVNMGSISFYLDLKIKRDRQNKILKLSQPIFIAKILAKYHLNQTKSYNIPIKKIILLSNKGLKSI